MRPQHVFNAPTHCRHGIPRPVSPSPVPLPPQSILVWDWRRGAHRAPLTGHADKVNGVSLSCDRRCLVSGSADGTLAAWQLGDGRRLRVMQGHSAAVLSVSCSPIARHLCVSGSADATVRVWNHITGACERVIASHEAPVTSVAFSPDGARFASASEDMSICVFDAMTGALQLKFLGHKDYVTSCVWSPDGNTLVSSSRDYTFQSWDAAVRCVSAAAVARGFSASTPFCPFALTARPFFFRRRPIRPFSFGRVGERLAALDGHTQPVSTVAYSPDNMKILSSSVDGTIRIWDVVLGESIVKMEGHTSGVLAAIYHPAAHTILSASIDQTIKVWDAETGACQRTLSGHAGPVSSLLFQKDASHFVSGSHDGTIRVWNAASFETVRQFRGHQSKVTVVVFHPSETRIASGSWDNTVRIWDYSTGKCLVTGIGHTDAITGLAYTPSATQLASCSIDVCLSFCGGHENTRHPSFHAVSASPPLSVYNADVDSHLGVGWLLQPHDCHGIVHLLARFQSDETIHDDRFQGLSCPGVRHWCEHAVESLYRVATRLIDNRYSRPPIVSHPFCRAHRGIQLPADAVRSYRHRVLHFVRPRGHSPRLGLCGFPHHHLGIVFHWQKGRVVSNGSAAQHCVWRSAASVLCARVHRLSRSDCEDLTCRPGPAGCFVIHFKLHCLLY